MRLKGWTKFGELAGRSQTMWSLVVPFSRLRMYQSEAMVAQSSGTPARWVACFIISTALPETVPSPAPPTSPSLSYIQSLTQPLYAEPTPACSPSENMPRPVLNGMLLGSILPSPGHLSAAQLSRPPPGTTDSKPFMADWKTEPSAESGPSPTPFQMRSASEGPKPPSPPDAPVPPATCGPGLFSSVSSCTWSSCQLETLLGAAYPPPPRYVPTPPESHILRFQMM